LGGDIFIITTILSGIVVFGIIAKYFFVDKLNKLPINKALQILIIFHAFRYLGLTFLLPDNAVGDLPDLFTYPVAIGDAISAILALAGFFLLQTNSKMSIPTLWFQNAFGLTDLSYALISSLVLGANDNGGGAIWWIISLWVPFLLVTHFLMINLLIKKERICQI